jgi:hypothetical protein
MPHSSLWQRSLSGRHGAEKANALIARTQVFYKEFLSQHSGESNRANRATLKSRLLPGLSIYRALLEEGRDQQQVLAEVDALFRAVFFKRMVQGIRVLNYFPDPFPIVKPVLKMMTRENYLPGSQEIVEDSSDCYAMNVYRCYILDTLTKHGAQELTAVFCNTDDWLTEVLPKIGWERTKTLGRGGDCCNFRWRRIRSKPV